jgi:hypothetical protein
MELGPCDEAAARQQLSAMTPEGFRRLALSPKRASTRRAHKYVPTSLCVAALRAVELQTRAPGWAQRDRALRAARARRTVSVHRRRVARR